MLTTGILGNDYLWFVHLLFCIFQKWIMFWSSIILIFVSLLLCEIMGLSMENGLASNALVYHNHRKLIRDESLRPWYCLRLFPAKMFICIGAVKNIETTTFTSKWLGIKAKKLSRTSTRGFRDSLTSIFVFVRTNALLATKCGTWFLWVNETQNPEYFKCS